MAGNSKTREPRHIVLHPTLGPIERVHEERSTDAILPSESRKRADREYLRAPIIHKLQSLALPDDQGRIGLNRATLRQRWRVRVITQQWKFLNPAPKSRRDKWVIARCWQFQPVRTSGEHSVAVDLAPQTLWARPDLHVIWSGEANNPEPPAEPEYRRVVSGDALWSRLSDIRFKPGTEAAARQVTQRIADSFNRQAFQLAVYMIPPSRDSDRYKFGSLLRKRLLRHHPLPGPVFIRSLTLRRWLRHWRYMWNFAIDLPHLAEYVERLNETLPEAEWLLRPQDLKAMIEAHQSGAEWRLLVRHGHAVVRPFDQADARRTDDYRALLAPLVVQARLGRNEVFPPWFLRAFVAMREGNNAPPLGTAGWRYLSPALLREAGLRAYRAEAAATRKKLLAQVSLLLACPSQPELEVSFVKGGWQAAIATARQISDASADTAHLHGLDFVPLTTAAALDDEGDAMSHCLSEYYFGEKLTDPSMHFVSVRLPGGKRLATATLKHVAGIGWHIIEQNAEDNERPDSATGMALVAYARRLPAPAC